MLATTSGLQQLLILACAGVLGAIILGFGRAVMSLIRTRQTKQRDESFDQRTLSEFFFDTERDKRTGAPAKLGWTTKVDDTLASLAKGQATIAANQAKTDRAVQEILYELKPNGGGNFRGVVERNAQAARDEVEEQIHERARVQERDDRMGHA